MLGIVVRELASRRLWVTNGCGSGRRGAEAGQLLWLSFDLWEQPIGVEDLQLLFKEPFQSPTRRCNRRAGLQSQQSEANHTEHHHQGLSRGKHRLPGRLTTAFIQCEFKFNGLTVTCVCVHTCE